MKKSTISATIMRMSHTEPKIKIALFDADGVTMSAKKFSVDYERDFGLHPDKFLPFFKGPFQDCLLGKADLKIAVEPYLKGWNWTGTAEEFLAYWFKSEDEPNEEVISTVKELREQGVKCYLATNQEKYRTEYMRENMNFKNVFDAIYASADLACKKPNREFYERLLVKIDPKQEVSVNEVLFWDDLQPNIDTAHELGIRAYRYQDKEEFNKVMSPILEALVQS